LTAGTRRTPDATQSCGRSVDNFLFHSATFAYSICKQFDQAEPVYSSLLFQVRQVHAVLYDKLQHPLFHSAHHLELTQDPDANEPSVAGVIMQTVASAFIFQRLAQMTTMHTLTRFPVFDSGMKQTFPDNELVKFFLYGHAFYRLYDIILKINGPRPVPRD
jgi:hypothetical protein